MRDSVGVVTAWQGADPEKATLDEYMKAIDKVQEEVDSGQIRGFTGNEYMKDIPKGDSWIILGWSGDAVQLKADNPNIEFVLPESGGMLWTDNMQIPVGAPHAYTAEKFIDYIYQPEVAGPDRGVHELHLPGERRQGGAGEDGPDARREPADLPGHGRPRQHVHLHGA